MKRIVPSPHSRHLAGVCLLLMLLFVSSGCVRRRLTVRSDPPGAKVYIDDQEIGSSPASTYFNYYAGRKVTLVKDGYRTETVYQNIDPPWYEYPPFDFFAENLWPREIRDERVLEFRLLPDEAVPDDRLLSNANRLRRNARTGDFAPLLDKEIRRERDPRLGVPGMGLPENAPLPGNPIGDPAAPPGT